MFKTKEPFPRHEFADRLDKLIGDGMRAGMSAFEIGSILEQRCNGMRQREAASYSSASRVVSGNI
jgi:hypothetical protein